MGAALFLSVILAATGRQDRVAHSVEEFLVGGNDRGQPPRKVTFAFSTKK